MPPRKLSLDDLAAARRLYEVDGLSYREIGEQYGATHTTMRRMLGALGVTSRPVGFQRRQQPAPAAVVEIVRQPGLPLRIPLRTAAERRLRRFTPPELQAIALELAAGRVQRVRRGRSGMPERRSVREAVAAGIMFYIALKKVKAAA